MTVLNAPPVPLTSPEPQPVTGPTPTTTEVRAAAERLALHDDRDVAAAQTIAARLGQLAAADPEMAYTVAYWLAHGVAAMANYHAGCTVVGCTRCLYLTDALAAAQAWKDGPR